MPDIAMDEDDSSNPRHSFRSMRWVERVHVGLNEAPKSGEVQSDTASRQARYRQISGPDRHRDFTTAISPDPRRLGLA